MGRFFFAGLTALSLAAGAASAQDLVIPDVRYPDLPRTAASAEGFAPPGWRIEQRREGDINGDGAADLALVLRATDPANRLVNESFGPNPFDTNPRILAVAFANRGAPGFRLAVQNQTLVPRPTMPIAEDPLSPDDSEFGLENGTLTVGLYRFSSSGGWDAGSTTFKFRWRDNALRLIGYDYNNVHRASGCFTSISINYVTGRAKFTLGSIGDDEERVVWRRLPARTAPDIGAIGDGFEFDPQGYVSNFPLPCAGEE